MDPSWSLFCRPCMQGGRGRAHALRFLYLHMSVPGWGPSPPWLPSHLHSRPQPPPYCSATAGSTRGQRDSRLPEPHFPHGGWVAQTGARWPRQEAGRAVQTRSSRRSEGGILRRPLALLRPSLKCKELWSQTASCSNPPLPSSWLDPPQDSMTLTSELTFKGSKTRMPTGSWQMTWWPGVELRSLPGHHPSLSHSPSPGGGQETGVARSGIFPPK